VRAADLYNVSVAAAEWNEGVLRDNPLLNDQRVSRIGGGSGDTKTIDNSGTHGNYLGTSYRDGAEPFDLSQRIGYSDGEMAPDDGTNTARRGVICSWDSEAEVWVRPDGSTFPGR